MKRSGFSLIELLAVITGLAVVVGCAVGLIELMMGMSDDVRERTHTIATLSRMADQFRRDVHNSHGQRVIAENRSSAELEFLGGVTVRWETDEQGNVWRSESNGGSLGRKTTYELPRGTNSSLEEQKQGAARIMVLKIESPNAAGPSLTVEALVGRDAKPAEEATK